MKRPLLSIRIDSFHHQSNVTAAVLEEPEHAVTLHNKHHFSKDTQITSFQDKMLKKKVKDLGRLMWKSQKVDFV